MNDRAPPGRPREFDLDQTVGQMSELFWQRGYADTSMSGLVEVSGVQKASLYAAFGGKQDIYEQCLASHCRELLEQFRLSLMQGHPRDRFSHILSCVVARAAAHDRTGCFLCAAASDHAVFFDRSGSIARVALGRLERIFRRALDPVYPDARQSGVAAKRMLATYVAMQTLARGGYPAGALAIMAEDAVATIPDARSIR